MPSVQQIEDKTSDFNRYYHQAGDTVEHMDPTYWLAMMRGLAATMATWAGVVPDASTPTPGPTSLPSQTPGPSASATPTHTVPPTPSPTPVASATNPPSPAPVLLPVAYRSGR